jgi:phosphatidylcholine synthase
VDAKTDDHYFLGFPSYFNVVAFYAIVFELGPSTLATVLVVCSLLVFIPIRYVYPTRTIAFRKFSLALTTLWLVSYAAILMQMPEPDPLLLTFSILYLFYYFGLSFYLSSKLLEERHAQETEA